MRIVRKALAILLVFAMMSALSGCLLMPQEEKETITVPPIAAGSSTDYQKKLDEVISILDKYYIDGYDTSKLGDYLAEAAVNASGDRWSYYMTAEEYNTKLEEDNNAYVGIGVTVNATENGIMVTDVTKNGGAEEAGILLDDIIVSVDGKDIRELDMDAVKNMIRGEQGTEVTLTILRGEENLDITVTRKVIQIEVVAYELMEDTVGYIQIVQFTNNVSTMTIQAIETLIAQGATSLVFDLRFNPGGFKDELVKLLDYLLPEGALFRSVDYEGKEEVDHSDAKCLKMPMAVLINQDSYSAAEFFAAALQEYEWATIVGMQTTGKANYQQTFKLSDGSAIAISTGHYQTPKGVTLEGIGVKPDVEIDVDAETYYDIYYGRLSAENDAQLQAAIAAVK